MTVFGITGLYQGLTRKGASELSHIPKSFYARFGKRLLDVVVVTLCAPVALPCAALMLAGACLYAGKPIAVETRIGRNGDGFRVLRAPSSCRDWGGLLDLPLLFNVLKGDLSLVGPRPMTGREAKAHRGISYYHLRPGLIDPCTDQDAIVRSPSAEANKNAEYLVNQSLFVDLLAIWKRCLS